MELKFTVRNIREIEQKSGKSIYHMVAGMRVSDLLLFIEKGLGMGKTEMDAENVFQSELESGKSSIQIWQNVQNILIADRFLESNGATQEVTPEQREQAMKAMGM